MAEIHIMQRRLQPAATFRALAESVLALGRSSTRRRSEKRAEFIQSRRLGVALQTGHGGHPKDPVQYCPQHNAKLVYDSTEDGWEHYLCPVYRCTSKLAVLLLGA